MVCRSTLKHEATQLNWMLSTRSTQAHLMTQIWKILWDFAFGGIPAAPGSVLLELLECS